MGPRAPNRVADTVQGCVTVAHVRTAAVAVAAVLICLVVAAAVPAAASPTDDPVTDNDVSVGDDPVIDGDDPATDGDEANTTTGANASANHRDTTALWRGFRHAWSYNHRFNRFGSWVDVDDCGRDICDYEVGHSGASGSGKDKAAVRDAYTELSASNVEFETGDVTFDIEGTEKTPKGGDADTIRVEEEVELDVGDDIGDYEEYEVVLNGFDATSIGTSAKVIDFELTTSDVKRTDDTLVFTVSADVLLDCDSFECEGRFRTGFKKQGNLIVEKTRGGKLVQDVDYELDAHYLVIGGDAGDFVATPTDEIENDYAWDRCLNNKVENPFTDTSEDDKWAGNFFPGNRMNCERSTGRELDHSDYRRQTSVRSGGGGYSVGTVGVKSISVNLEHESHFTQYDTVVGGSYSGNGYDVRALPFFKEWSSRPGQYDDARFSYGFEGSGSVGVDPVLLEFRDACKRSFVTAGGIKWRGGGADANTPEAVVSEEYRFAYADQWRDTSDRGSACESDIDPLSRPSSPTADPAFWVPANGGSLWSEFGTQREDPTKLDGSSSDRYYSGEQENKPVDTAEIRNVEFADPVDDDDDGKVAELLFQLDADLRYDDPLDDSDYGDPVVTVEFRRSGCDCYSTRNVLEPVARDSEILLGPVYDEYTSVPSGTYTHLRVSIHEKRGGGKGPLLDRAVVPFPGATEFEKVENDRVVAAYFGSNPEGAEVYLDGQNIGETPLEGAVPAGQERETTTLEFREEGYQPTRFEIQLQEGRGNRYVVDLKRPDEPIVVQSTPNATVYFDGIRQGETPLTEGVPPGDEVDVRLEAEDSLYLEETFRNVSSPATINASLDLYTPNYTLTPNYTVVINGTNGGDGGDGDDDGDNFDNIDEDDGLVVDYPDIDDRQLDVVDPGVVEDIPDLSGIVVANATVPLQLQPGTSGAFDASGSYSLGDPIEGYRWSFGPNVTARGEVVQHSYATPGTKQVTLTVIANGTRSKTTREVEVGDQPPTARFSVSDRPVQRGDPVTFDASASIDPEGSVSQVDWQMGDGIGRTGTQVDHTYTTTGNVTVTARVVDAAGNADTLNRTIRVHEPNDPPRADVDVDILTAEVGETVTFDAAGSGDPDGAVTAYNWQLGNGAVATGETIQFAYSSPGQYQVTLAVVDDDGSRTTTTETVRVTPQATTTTTPPSSTSATTSDPTASTTDSTTTRSTEKTTASSTDESTVTDDEGDGDDGVLPTPGFGVAVAVLALVGAALLVRRRR